MKSDYNGYIAPNNANDHHQKNITNAKKVTAYGSWVKIVKAPHECGLPTKVLDDIIEGSIWQCDECKTRWVYKGVMPWSKYGSEPNFEKEGEYAYQDDAYCVYCKEKVFIENRRVKVSDSGRKMAQGNCGRCGAKVNRILGKDAK